MNEKPTTFFRGIDPKLVAAEAALGTYNFSINDLPPTRLNTAIKPRDRLIPGDSPIEKSFKIKSKSNNLIMTTNHENFTNIF